ncbi:MAG: hypothetical protein SQA66_00220 [Candidatus Fervidibacter sacchari]
MLNSVRFDIEIWMIPGSVSLFEVLQQLFDALRALQLGGDAIGILCDEPLPWNIIFGPPERSLKLWKPDLTKTFTENLDAFQAWVQSVLEEKKSLPDLSVGLYIAWPKPASWAVIGCDADYVYLSYLEEDVLKGRQFLWDELMEFTKRLAATLPTDFAFSCVAISDMRTEVTRLKNIFKRHKVIKELPRLDALLPKRAKRKWKPYYFPYPSFLILSRERFQACQPYLSHWPTIQSQEELPNGAVFLFFGYPIQFEALQGFEFSLEAEEEKGGERGIFVAVPMYPDEDLDEAYKRITKAFEEAGIEVYHPQMLHNIAPITDFARLFIVFTENEAHTFFICPYDWTPERVEKMLVMVAIVKEMEKEKVIPGVAKHFIHFLSAYPLPKVLEEVSKG